MCPGRSSRRATRRGANGRKLGAARQEFEVAICNFKGLKGPSMSVNAGQLFVRFRETKTLLEYLKQFLAFYGKNYPEELHRGGPFYDGKGGRTLTVLPHCRGWTTLLEGSERTADFALALQLSKKFACKVIGLEVQGCVFNYKWTCFENGEPRGEGQLLKQADESSEVIPDFKDAEQLAWDEAIKMGVPSEILFLRKSDLSICPEGSPINASRVQLLKSGEEWKLAESNLAVRMPLEPTQPRVYLDMAITGETNGEVRLAIESRYLWGNPEPASVERLCHLLRRIQRRYSRATRLPLEKIKFMVFAGASHREPVSLAPDLESGTSPLAASSQTPEPDSAPPTGPKKPPLCLLRD